jgi:hypothetical protein
MPDDELATQPDADRMLEAALGGLTLHQLLMQTSLADSANVAERQAAIAKNRERALKLLAAIDKSLA